VDIMKVIIDEETGEEITENVHILDLGEGK